LYPVQSTSSEPWRALVGESSPISSNEGEVTKDDEAMNKNKITIVNAVTDWAKRGLAMPSAVPSYLKETSPPEQVFHHSF
jgi:predicted nucleic acid-binding Zn ribbon protein